MNFNLLIKLTENDKRVIIALLFAIILLFVIIGLLGSLIVRTMRWQGKKCDTLVSDVVTNHIVKTPHQLRKYAAKKNIRHFLKQAWIPIIIILVGVATILIRNAITKDWSYDLLNYNNGTKNEGGTGFGTLLWIWDFKDPDSYTTVFGLKVLAKWPPLYNNPHFVMEGIYSYVAIPFLVIGSIWYLVVAQAYLARTIRMHKLSKQVFEKSLEGFNGNTQILGQNPQPTDNQNNTEINI
jgi:hypothetical protein